MAEGNRVLTKEKKHNNEIHKSRKDRHPGVAHLRGLHVVREAYGGLPSLDAWRG